MVFIDSCLFLQTGIWNTYGPCLVNCSENVLESETLSLTLGNHLPFYVSLKSRAIKLQFRGHKPMRFRSKNNFSVDAFLTNNRYVFWVQWGIGILYSGACWIPTLLWKNGVSKGNSYLSSSTVKFKPQLPRGTICIEKQPWQIML